MKTWHKLALVAAALLALASWAIAIFYWGKLPAVIPTHFGWNGSPDGWGQKSVWYVFMMPAIQTVLTGLFVFLYYKPQYSDMPTTLWLMTMKADIRDHAFALIRTMLVGTGLWIGVLFTYITYTMSTVSATNNTQLNPWLLLLLIGGMLIWLTWWTLKVYKVTKEVMKGSKNV